MCKSCGFSPGCKTSRENFVFHFIKSLIFGSVFFFATPSDSFYCQKSCTPATRSMSFSLKATVIMPPADLTPAVDKFARLPPPQSGVPTAYTLTAKGPAPSGPEPFGMVADELQSLSDYVRELVVSENPVLTMAASHFFDQVSISSAFQELELIKSLYSKNLMNSLLIFSFLHFLKTLSFGNYTAEARKKVSPYNCGPSF